MKKIIALVIGLATAGICKADTNDWVAPVTITNTTVITAVKIDNIIINILPTKKIQLSVDWSMKAVDGTIIKSGRSIYPEEQVDAILQSQEMSIAMLRNMFLAIVAAEVSK